MQHYSVMLVVHTAVGAVSCESTGAHHGVECDIQWGATRATISSRHFSVHPLPSTSYPPPWIHGCEYDSEVSLSKSCPHML